MRWFAFVVALIGATASHAETIVIGTEAEFPPVMFRDANGNLIGRDKDIGDEICARAGWTCSWFPTEFGGLLPGVAGGQFDLAIGGISASPDRRELVDFSDIYREPSANISYYAGIKDGIDPSKSRISVQAGTTQEAFLREQGLDIRPYPDNYAALHGMLQGEADLFFGPGLFLKELVDEEGYGMLVENGTESVRSWGPGIAIAKGRDDMLAELNRVIQSMWEDGTLDLLHNKWTRQGSDT